MYWYVKAILIVAVVLIVGIVVAVFWKHIPKPELGGGDEPEPVAVEQGPADVPVTPAEPVKPTIPPELSRGIMQAREKLRAEDPLAARQIIEEAMQSVQPERFGGAWDEATAVLSEANTRLIGGTIPSEQMITYQVKSGDSLWAIARKLGVSIDQLRRNSGLPPDSNNIRPGQTLRVYQGDWNVLIDIDEYRLLLFDGERLVKVYPIGIGRQGRTPTGTFTVGVKQKDPVWQPPGRVVPFGHPDNPLGSRWMQLVPSGESVAADLQGYGIHGTRDETSVGKAESNGCIRMRKADVEELYDLAVQGTPVVIQE